MSILAEFLISILSDKRIGLPFLRRHREASELARIQIARIERLATALADLETQQILAGERRFEDIPLTLNGLPEIALTSTYKAAKRIEPTVGDCTVLQEVAIEAALDHLRYASNVDAALSHAYELLLRDPGPAPSTIIESDWLFRWRASAAEVSDQDIQTLLGQLLAGEIKQPGTFSYRTLSFLRTASSKELQTIKSICPYIFNRNIFDRQLLWMDTTTTIKKSQKDRIYFTAPFPAPVSIQSYVDLITLGIISPAGDAETAMYWHSEPSPSMEIGYFGRTFRITKASESKLPPPFNYLTGLGGELVDLVSRNLILRPVEGYIESMIAEFKRYQQYDIEEILGDLSKPLSTGECTSTANADP